MTLMIDTLRTARRLEQAGFTPSQAETLVRILAEVSGRRSAHLPSTHSKPPLAKHLTNDFKFWLVVSQTFVFFAIATVLHFARNAG